MEFYELIALIWILAGLATALTWLILGHRRAQARTALEARNGAESTQLADLQTRVGRMENPKD
ncbi:hypothetical protein ACFOOK_02355 [Micromonospora krabiensis]|uniref:Uncharacterized protein n=1 Tax=Micromonospora krabiensis TaxID=307121 RepID=A0A1C3MWV2_9ACTN|nr:hypothetical protein [Micromonospora krabiensis]SBV24797.1 hypothetical protein GA0070620_0238 [Micromonospora krabiensis]